MVTHIPVTVRNHGQDSGDKPDESLEAVEEGAQEIATADGVELESKGEKEETISEEDNGPEELDIVKREAEEYKDKYLRARAEMANYKKRLARQYEERTEAEKKRLLRDFLAVMDDLERALSQAEVSEDGLREGLQLTHQALQRMLTQEGVEALSPEGKPFDPLYHEAVAMVSADAEPETVVGQVRKGYLYRGELLRPARVQVAR
jgi:molecular chaperone GrpE